jgi:hypothetical protein
MIEEVFGGDFDEEVRERFHDTPDRELTDPHHRHPRKLQIHT